MDVQITSGPAFAMGTITLHPGGSVRVEAGAMAMTRGDISVETSTRGGFMSGLNFTDDAAKKIRDVFFLLLRGRSRGCPLSISFHQETIKVGEGFG